ncbi:MAG: hypothetical protein Q4C49_01435 [Bacillota bacterium]|nr:hypothetical protein [Bacillota bacterium]
MVSFYTLSSSIRALFSCWVLVLTLFGILDTIYALFLKRYKTTILGFFLVFVSIFFRKVLLDHALERERIILEIPRISAHFMNLPWIWWLITCILMTFVSGMFFYQNVLYDKTYITPATIKYFMDHLPDGICYWRNSGQIVLSNSTMERLCVSLTNQPLLNGNIFFEAIIKDIFLLEDRVWKFSYRELSLQNESLYELIASDITEEYLKTKELEKETEKLYILNKKLQEYHLEIEESVRKQEILQAKINIHDEMNRLMLLTVLMECKDFESTRPVFSLWKKNALVLCRESEKEKLFKDEIELFSKQMNVRLVWKNKIPEYLSKAQKELFYSALWEAVINAVKHAKAKTMTIAIEEKEEEICCVFENDGNVPLGKISFTGGLYNLSILANEQGATLQVESQDSFLLKLTFPKIVPSGTL